MTDSLDVEMTAYVLLGLMSTTRLSVFDLDYAASIVDWLTLQQNAFGGFASTQVQIFNTSTSQFLEGSPFQNLTLYLSLKKKKQAAG